MNMDSNMEVTEIAGEKPEAYLDCWRTSKNVAGKDGSGGKLAKDELRYGQSRNRLCGLCRYEQKLALSVC